jgi:hypothetical protein
MRKRGQPWIKSNGDARRALLARLDRTEPKAGAARLIYEALEREGAG